MAALLALRSASPAWVADPAASDQAKQTWQLLDYLAVDYGGAVSDGKVPASTAIEVQDGSPMRTSADADCRSHRRAPGATLPAMFR